MDTKSVASVFNGNVAYQGVPNPGQVYYNEKPVSSPTDLPIGKPERKALFNWLDTSALVGSLISLGGCIAVLSPVGSFNLGYNLQITVIGFLLSIQALCLRRNLIKLFLQVEARFGHSTIQNYDAIRTNSIFLDHTSMLWRLFMVLFVALPLGLSLAYKQFPGGFSTMPIEPIEGKQANIFAVAAVPGTYEFGSRYGQSLINNITLPFASTTTNDSIDPTTVVPPGVVKPYGYNNLLLSPDKVATLDGPHPLYIKDIQRALQEKDTIQLTATVNASITTYNRTIDQNRNDPTFWRQFFNTSIDGISGIITLRQGFSLQMRTGVEESNPATGAQQQFGHIDSFPIAIALIPDQADTSAAAMDAAFRRYAHMVTITRRACTATWEVTPSSIQLQGGVCDEQKVTATRWGAGFHFDGLALRMLFLPALLEFLGPFTNSSDSAIYGTTRFNSPWYPSTLATVVGNMVWARNAALGLRSNATSATVQPDAQYRADMNMRQTRATVYADFWIYFIVAIMPAMNALAWAMNMGFFQSPIDAHFNAVSLLAGVERASLSVLRGAGFSGATERPVRLQIAVRSEIAGTDLANEGRTELRYIVDGHEKNDRLSRRDRRVLLH